MKLTYPIFPMHVNQPFGSNPAYYARFLDENGHPQKGHMGIDFMALHGQPVYACHDGFAFYVGPDEHGGDGIYLNFEDEENPGTYYTVIYWHLCELHDPKFPPKVDGIGRKVKRGELIGYADNSGAPFESSGDHLHFGLVQANQNGRFLNTDNGFGGCINPAPYLVFPAPPGVPAPVPADTTVPDLVKAETKVLNETTDPSVRSAFIALIIKQLREFFGW